MAVEWHDHSYGEDQHLHTTMYSVSAGLSFIVFCLYLTSGIHKTCSGNLIVNRVLCDTAYFTAQSVSSEVGLGQQVCHA